MYPHGSPNKTTRCSIELPSYFPRASGVSPHSARIDKYTAFKMNLSTSCHVVINEYLSTISIWSSRLFNVTIFLRKRLVYFLNVVQILLVDLNFQRTIRPHSRMLYIFNTSFFWLSMKYYNYSNGNFFCINFYLNVLVIKFLFSDRIL